MKEGGRHLAAPLAKKFGILAGFCKLVIDTGGGGGYYISCVHPFVRAAPTGAVVYAPRVAARAGGARAARLPSIYFSM